MRLTDWRGNEYGLGDMVLYSRCRGHVVEMVEARVVEIIETGNTHSPYKVVVLPTGKTSRGYGFWGEPKKLTITVTKNVTAIGRFE